MNSTKTGRLLDDLFARLGVEGIEPGDDGAYGLLFDDDLSVACRLAPSAIRFESRVCVLPPDASDRDELLDALLGQSAARMREQASVLYLDPDASALMLYRSVAQEGAETPVLHAALEEFLASLEHWRASAGRDNAVPRSGAPTFAHVPMSMAAMRFGR